MNDMLRVTNSWFLADRACVTACPLVCLRHGSVLWVPNKMLSR